MLPLRLPAGRRRTSRRDGAPFGEGRLYFLWIPRTADHARVDAANTHAQLPAVAARDLASVLLYEARGVNFHVRVQLAFGERNGEQLAAGHAQMLCSQLPSAA